MYFFPSLAVLALAVMTLPLRGESTVIVSLDSVGDRIRAQNPELAAARLRIHEALGRMKQSGRFANPELETILENNTRFREGRFQVEISQRFPVTNRLRLEKEISLTELKASEMEVREIERQLIARARDGVVKLLAARQCRNLLAEQSTASKKLAAFLADAATRGEGSALEAGQAKLESTSLLIETRRLAAEEAAFVGDLKSLLGMRPSDSLSIGGTLPEPSFPKGAVAQSRRSDLQVAQLEATAAAQGVTLEQARRYDDVEGGLFAAAERSEDAPKGYDNEGIVGLRVKIPLPLWNNHQGAIESARAQQQRKEMEAIALSRTIHQQVETARAEMTEWAALVREISHTLLPLANEQAVLTETAHREGHGNIQSVFRYREKVLQLATARLDSLREFHLARVRYESALAQP
jgi:cobalt-zinc-cadmium efflux system outer membrane protein